VGLGRRSKLPQLGPNFVHFSFKMTSGGNSFNDFPETVPTREITIKTDKTLFSSVTMGLFLEWAECCSIKPSTAPTLILR